MPGADQALTDKGAGRRGRPARLAILAILLAGALLRFAGIDFGLPLEVHPDEGKVLSAALGFGSGDLNPHFFRYPTLLMYMLFCLFGAYYAIGRAVGWFADSFDFAYQYAKNPTTVIVIARAAVATMGTATLGIAYLLGKRLGGRVVGIVALAWLSISFLHVADSHYATTDVPAGLWCTCCLLFVVRWQDLRKTRDLILAGVATGLAASTRYNAALVGAALVPAAITYTQVGPLRRLWSLVLAGAVCAIAFAATSPFVLLDHSAFLADFRFSMKHAAGGHFGILGSMTGWEYYALKSLPQGIGPAAAALSMIGLTAAILRPRRAALGPALFSIAYFGVVGSWRMTFDRFLMPIVPALCVFAALGLKGLLDWAPSAPDRKTSRILLVGLAVIGSLKTTVAVVWHDMLLLKEDTRVYAQRWISENLQPGEAVLLEEYGPQPRPAAPTASRGNEEVAAVKDRIKLRIAREEPTYIVERFMDGYPYDINRVREDGIRFVILSSYVYERFLAEPGRYPEPLRFYGELPSITTVRTVISPFKRGCAPPLPDVGAPRRPFPMRTLYGPAQEDMFDRVRPGPALIVYEICPKGYECPPLPKVEQMGGTLGK